MRSAGSEEESLGLSPPRFCIGKLPRFRSIFQPSGNHGRAALPYPAQRRRSEIPGARAR
jgi:hypothetical protein